LSGPDGGPPLRLLVVEDNVAHAKLVRRVLEALDRPVSVHHAGTLASACARLRAESFDAVLSDLHLPDSQGVAIVVRLAEISPSTPLLVVSAVDDPALALASLADGAHDFLAKDRLTPELVAHALLRASQRAAARKVVDEGVLVDRATGVFNRKGMDVALRRVVSFARRQRHPVRVVLLTVAGSPEQVEEVVRLAAQVCRDADVVGRLDATRVVLALPDDQSDPPALVGRLLPRVEQSPILAGVAVDVEVRHFDPARPTEVDELLRIPPAVPVRAAASEVVHRVLVVTADAETASAVAGALDPQWAVFEAAGEGQALRLAALEEPTLVIVDLDIDGGQGPVLIRKLRQNGAMDVPVLAVGDRGDLPYGALGPRAALIDRRSIAADLGYQAQRLLS